MDNNSTNINNSNRESITVDDIVRQITNKDIPESLDDIYTMCTLGSRTNALGNHFFGLNHQQTPTLIPHNTDQNGYVFFTRPRLNLTTGNIINSRKLTNLLDNNSKSLARIVRNTLDPVLAKNVSKYPCPFVDPENVFIPFLTNSLLTMDSPPSTTMGVYTSGTPGVYKEVFSMADDIVIDHSAYNINCTFRNTQGNPFLLLFYSWMLYTSLQYLDEGPIPYYDDLNNNRMNYNTRIYRLVMDQSKRYVQHIWAPMYAFPTAIETGSIFSYDIINKPLNMDMSTLSIQFQCVGNYFNDHLLIKQFNTSVCLLNRLMRDDSRNKSMILIPFSLRKIFNNMGYPRINPDNNELEWWITKDQYNSKKDLIEKLSNYNNNVLKKK